MKLHNLLLLSLVTALASCGSSEEPTKTTDDSAKTTTEATADVAAGKAYYVQTCIPCHGEGGQGDGAASANLVPKPRDLTDSAWQASVDDEYLHKIVQYGGAAVGKAATMPANPVLGSQPEVLDGVVAYIRTLKK